MKKILSIALTLLLVLSLAACGGGKDVKNEIPDVFGIHYTDAIGILEAEGFTVSAVEASVDTFSVKLLYPLEKVDKGTVFKIDDYIIDNNGNLNKNYDVFYDEGLISDDKNLVIYYAKDDYVLVKNNSETIPSTEPSTETSTEPSTEPATEPATEATTTPPTEESKDSTAIDPEFKAAMDSYEEFMDGYVKFMKKYMSNPNDLSLLADYATYMGNYSDFVEDFEKWEDEDLNEAEAAYYLEVVTRVNKKMLEIAQ